MAEDQTVYVYFCLDADTREVVAAFTEFRNSNNDERYVKRAVYADAGSVHIDWVEVEGAPLEMTSQDFDVYCQAVTEVSATHKFGFVKALELLALGELDEDFLYEGSTLVPHR